MLDGGEGRGISAARVCIDFGTALSKASVCLDPTMPLELGVKPLAIGAVARAEHSLLVPSVLFVDGGRLFFGPDALDHARNGLNASRDPLLSFKTVLGARNLQEALTTRLPPSVDPTGTFRQRDALVLYLAYLDQLIREALDNAPNMPPNVAEAKRRYTSPVWRPGAGIDQVFEIIFNESDAVSRRLSKLLLAPDGVSIAQCRDALDKAAATPGDARLETGVFEPHAAAAASMAFTNMPTRFVLVFDMGAGTTDIAAFEFDESTEPPALSEIKAARQCSALAGDEIDRILIDLHMRKRGAGRNREEDLRAFRATRLSARELKKALFTQGRCVLKLDGKATAVRLEEFLEDGNFRKFLGLLKGAILASLAPVMERAMQTRSEFIEVVLAGGGSQLPFMADLVHSAAAERQSPVRLRVGPLSPASALYDSVDASLSVVFPQIAMSIGGALVEMMPP